jgi:hypothetical protein
MFQRTLPARPSIENLRKQAKDLAKAYRAGRPAARARVAAIRLAALPTNHILTLADAQHVLAREYGFKSWPQLVRHLTLDPVARRLHELTSFFRGYRMSVTRH